MKVKGVNYYISDLLWRKMLIYWDSNFNKKGVRIDKFYRIEYDSFLRYLARLSKGLFSTSYSSSILATLWGSVFVADYLKEKGIIDTKTYNDYIFVSRKLKGEFIAEQIDRLWENCFIHTWGKPDGISEDEFATEKKLFEKSFTIATDDFDAAKEQIADELNRMGELADYIYEANSIIKAEIELTKQKDNELEELESMTDEEFCEKYRDRIVSMANEDDLLDDDGDGYRELGAIEKPESNLPYRREKKIGRNEPCPCGSNKKYKKCCSK